MRLVFMDITPGLFALITVGVGARLAPVPGPRTGQSTLQSSNLNALRVNSNGKTQALIAARVLNYEELSPRFRSTANAS